MSRLRVVAASAALAVALGASGALAADIVRPVVVPVIPPKPGPTVKVEAFGGEFDRKAGWGVAGSLTVPLQQKWGVQIDGMGGSAGGSTFAGAAGHLFARDPAKGLFGLYGSYVNWTPIGAQVTKLGGEAQLYLQHATLTGILAWQTGTFKGVAGNATLSFYVADNFRLDASYRYLQGIGHIWGGGAELQLGNNSGWALFANAGFGQNNYRTIFGGLKFYTGPAKTLIRRQREDDPDNVLPLDLLIRPAQPVKLIIGT